MNAVAQAIGISYKVLSASKYAPAIIAAYYYAQQHPTRKKARQQKKGKVKTLAKMNRKRINYLKKQMQNNESTIIYRSRKVQNSTNIENKCLYHSRDALSASLIALAVTALKYFDPTAPATLTTVNYNTGTFHKQILLQSSSKIRFQNNYRVPLKFKLYLCKVKADTDNSPKTALTAGFADVGALADTNPLSKAEDSLILKDLWNCTTIQKEIILPPGGILQYSHFEKPFAYDTSLVDTHNLEYIKQFRNYQWLYRVEGLCAHDTVLDEQGTQPSGVDVTVDNQIIIKYDGGIDLYEIQTANDSKTFTNSGVLCVIDNENIPFSLA